jgi:5-deoxy-glucuronate isomerase
VSSLLVRPSSPDGVIVSVSPESAGWSYVSFEVLRLGARPIARDTGDRELCLVVVEGRCSVRSDHGDWSSVGSRPDPFSGPPEAAYLPPGTRFEVEAADDEAEVALCSAPAETGGAPARLLPGHDVKVEPRGSGTYGRVVKPILMEERAAQSLLVCEVLTPPGHWSSYPPHKHDRHAPPVESFLEETYYHRIEPSQGFALQRVYTGDGTLDETLTVHDRDVVLVPRGYHTVSAPPGYTDYYLNVMAGPTRTWAVANDPDHEWTLTL